MSCRSSKQVQLDQHVIENSVDSTTYQATTSSHTTVDSTITSIGGKDIVVDIVETIEHYDTLGRITQKQTKTTNIHHKDSVTTVKDSHKIFADSTFVGKVEISHKDTDSTIKEKTKTSKGITFFGSIAIILLLVVVIFICILARKILCKL